MATFTMQVQQTDEWCWAAVAVAIHNFLDSNGPPLTQAALATIVLQKEGKIASIVNCELTPDLCVFPAALTDALTATGNLSAPALAQPLTFNSLMDQINAGIPVCVQIDWFDGGAHAIVLNGYQTYTSGAQAVLVQDPFYQSGFHFYDDLVNNYPPGGIWADTFLVKA